MERPVGGITAQSLLKQGTIDLEQTSALNVTPKT